MYEDDTGRPNASGCPDPTHRVAVATAMGCNVLNRIELQDRETGEVSR